MVNFSDYIEIGKCGSCPVGEECKHYGDGECLYVVCSLSDFVRYARFVACQDFILWLREKSLSLGANPLTALRVFRQSYSMVARVVATRN